MLDVAPDIPQIEEKATSRTTYETIPPNPLDALDDPFLRHHAKILEHAGTQPIEFGRISLNGQTECLGLDIETYPNFFCVCLMRFRDGAKQVFEQSERCKLDRGGLHRLLRDNIFVTFNGNGYDLIMLELAFRGRSCAELKAASDMIILSGLRAWEVKQELAVSTKHWTNHIDLMGPCPAPNTSLKIIAGRLHARFMVDLPFDPDTVLTPEQMNVVTLYCLNDLEHTGMLRRALREPLEMRIAMSELYGVDFRSKSDAQAGEKIVLTRVSEALRHSIPRVEPSLNHTFTYDVPEWVNFDPGGPVAPIVKQLRTAVFEVIDGKPQTPDCLKGLKLTIGGSTYKVGKGGLHSCEKNRAIVADADHILLDCDVASQYPMIIEKLGIYPKLLGPAFLKVYSGLIRERLSAKRSGEKTRADSLKIALNGVFGKLGSPHSQLYSPKLLLATTLTGQLSLLMLIEMTEACGISVVSGNTDGIVVYPRRNELDLFQKIVKVWEHNTGFTVEQTEYRAIYNSCVNTYIAVKTDGKVKTKGAPADPWSATDLRSQMMKNPQMTIVGNSIIKLVTEGVPLAETILACNDPRQLVTVIKVSGGGEWRGQYLGRAVRFYWSTDGDPITYRKYGRRVAKSEGARPLMELSDELPADVDWDRYLVEANRLAADLGVIPPIEKQKPKRKPKGTVDEELQSLPQAPSAKRKRKTVEVQSPDCLR